MSKSVLFLAQGASVQTWYRVALPAKELELDWAGLIDGPPGKGGTMIAGNITEFPNPFDYDIIVVQLVKGNDWVKFINELVSAGKTVYYECDDFLHGVHRIEDHPNKGAYAPKRVKEYVKAMKACSGIICSTEYLSEQYSKYNSNVFVAKNSIPAYLYDIEKIPKENKKIVLGWAGGAGHLQAFRSWYQELLDVMLGSSQTNFISVGVNYADHVAQHFPGRCISMPWTSLENYPYSLSAFDISIAPSHDSKYFRSKSDLRWLESSAIGIPTVVNPITYPEVEDGVTGMVASTPEEFETKLEKLIYDEDLRLEIGQNAKNYIKNNRDITVGARQWQRIFESSEN
jgi:hypothetical protein